MRKPSRNIQKRLLYGGVHYVGVFIDVHTKEFLFSMTGQNSEYSWETSSFQLLGFTERVELEATHTQALE